MKQDARELWLALTAIIAITAVYLLVMQRLQAAPAAGSLFGHGLGVAGFVLMLATETLYSLRKRSRRARWGRTASWLRFHIFTGLVGPSMVLLHSAWEFRGLAGVVLLLTLVVVASGFVGRYIYTAVPRNANGLVIEAAELHRQIEVTEAAVRQTALAMATDQPAAVQALLDQPTATSGEGWQLVLARPWIAWQQRRQRRHLLHALGAEAQPILRQLDELTARRDALRRQAQSLASARRLLGIWHTIHIPLGMALFTAAFVHIIAAIYFATLLH